MLLAFLSGWRTHHVPQTVTQVVTIRNNRGELVGTGAHFGDMKCMAVIVDCGTNAMSMMRVCVCVGERVEGI